MQTPPEPVRADDPVGVPPPPRWIAALLGLTAIGLVPWTLYLTFSLPSRHVTNRYDLAWVGFDVALAAAFAGTAWAALHGSTWLVPLAAATGTMLLCDAWFDVVTSAGGGDLAEAAAEALLAELPLAAVCAFIVYDAETFLRAMRVRRPKPGVRPARSRSLPGA
jgi:hypothetical protein